MNGTFNFTPPNLSLNSGLCIDKGIINRQCVLDEICHQTGAHYQGWALTLLAAFFIIDGLIPLALHFLGARLALLQPDYLAWAGSPEGRQSALSWLKARLLWGFVVFTLFRIVY
jgi:hypothetical protein